MSPKPSGIHRPTETPRRRRTLLAAGSLLTLSLLATACGSDKAATDTTVAGATETTAAATVETTTAADTTVAATTETTAASTQTTVAGTAGAAFDQARCDANKAAGKITYLSSFDFAAAASIVDVVVAKEKGYFDKMCLDVTLSPSFSTANYTLVAGGKAQFSSAGSYTEMLNFSKDGASFVALTQYGHTPIEELLVKADSGIKALADLKGKTIGAKGDIPPSLVAMLNGAGLKRGTDYKEVLLDGFDPVPQLKQVDALPVYKSNEPGQLDKAGVKYTAFNPSDTNIPGSFGILYTSKKFLTEHPTAAQDFIRASLKGMEDAAADPTGAVTLALKQITAAGNKNYLSQEGETFRWTAELAEVKKGTPSGPLGVIDPKALQAEVDAYAAAGVFKGAAPSIDGTYDATVTPSMYGPDGKVIWPAG